MAVRATPEPAELATRRRPPRDKSRSADGAGVAGDARNPSRGRRLTGSTVARLQRHAGNAAVVTLLADRSLSTRKMSKGSAALKVDRCGGAADCDCEPLLRQHSPDGAGDPQQQIKDALEQGKPGPVAALEDSVVARATQEQRLTMIDILNDQGSFTQRERLPHLWDSFGKGIKDVANANPQRWQTSFAVAAGFMRTSREVAGQQKVFYLDVEDVARRYLDQNEAYCKDEFKRLGLTEDGQVAIGPPTAEQEKALKATQADAAQLAADQEALRDLRKVVVGYASVELPPGGTGPPVQLGGPVTFDPERPPVVGPQPTDTTMKTWAEVKKAHDDLETLIRARMMVNPSLFPLGRDAHEDPTKAVATGPREQALSTIGSGLKGVLDNIAKTRPMLHTIAEDLDQIHGQLLAGTVTVAPDRNWLASPFFKTLGKDLVDQHKPGPWWQTLGLAAAEAGAYVVAGIATGGTALALGLAAKGAANVALSAGRAEALEAAAKSTTTPETELITQGQVDEAKAAVIQNVAFALLDTVVAAGTVRSALRSILQYEKVAAESAAKATTEAEKFMAKHARDAKPLGSDAGRAADEIRADSDKATKAAGDAKKGAESAGPEEMARANAASERAATNATKARQAAAELAALAKEGEGATHAPPRTVGEHTLKVRGNWVTRCSPEPCAELATTIVGRAKTGVASLGKSALGDRAKELQSRFTASANRAGRLAERSRNELTGVTGPNRVPIENRLMDEGAAIENEVQALERQVQLESMARGTVGKEWGELLTRSVRERLAAIRARAAGAGAVDPHLSKALRNYEAEAASLANDATRLEVRPSTFGRPRSEVETTLDMRWKKLDQAIEGTQQEEIARADARTTGGGSLGESDASVRQGLKIPPGGRAPDIARDLSGGRLLLAESKGTDVAGAIGQLEAGMNSPVGRTFTSFDLRIYVPEGAFEAMTRTGNIEGFAANNVGGRWVISGPRGLPVQILGV